jgi:hypothetical protein
VDDEVLPDYYQILQVHPEAEQEVIEAAFRRLMQKYHPDRLSLAQQQDSHLQERVRAITNAYHVLRNSDRRASYNYKRTTESLGRRLETRTYPALCSVTTSIFALQLICFSINPVFHVVGLDVVQRKTKPKIGLTDQLRQRLRQIFPWFSTVKSHHPPIQQTADLTTLFDPQLVIDFGDISWGGFTCPTCPGSFVFPDGMRSTWGVCGKCGRLYCAGGIRRTSFGGLVTCPACGTERQVTYHVRTGVKANKFVRGYTPSAKTVENGQATSFLPTTEPITDED